MGKIRAWYFLTVDHSQLQYGGNTGYLDDPKSLYRYDSEVGNHKQVSKGDLVVLRTKSSVLGIARIQEISAKAGSKFRQRCPTCKATTIKARHKKSPKWRCHNCSSEFEQALEEQILVTEYTASYADTFLGNTSGVALEALRKIVLRPSGQMSISELDLPALEILFQQEGGAAIQLFGEAALQMTVEPLDGAQQISSTIPGVYAGSAVDSRAKVLRAILERRGQSEFRRKLIERYGARCAISGCSLLSVLEAAHIDPYRGHVHNHTDNGLLLRADLHTLFDLGLLAIDPKDWTVHLHPEASAVDGYSQFHGAKLFWMKDMPSSPALFRRWLLFCET
jgi:putative restriction endonuclease